MHMSQRLPMVCISVFAPIALCQAQTVTAPLLHQPYTTTVGVAPSVIVTVDAVAAGYAGKLTPYSTCDLTGKPLGGPVPIVAPLAGQKTVVVPIALIAPLASGTTVCILREDTPVAGGTAIKALSSMLYVLDPDTPKVCQFSYSDCHWAFSAIGGVEQSDLSSQNSQTDGFLDAFIRGPVDSSKYIWTEVRLLGAPNNSNTQNIGSAVTNPSGTVTSSTLSTVGMSIDYIVGGEWDFSRTKVTGRFSVGAIVGFGATTPLSSQTATVAYAVPAYGTNECTQLINKFKGYSPALPGNGTVTTTNPTTGATTTSAEFCSVQSIAPGQPLITTTVNGTTVLTNGTQITNIAFAPEDRTSFLLKDIVGIRLIDRLSTNNGTECQATSSDTRLDSCARMIVDFTVGQDQDITAGYMRHLVFKSNFVFPIRKSGGIYIFGSAAMRVERNVNSNPLVLTQTPIATSSAAATPGTVTIPSPSVFVLPLKQSDRDFYRLGVALDLSTLFPKLFTSM